MLFRSVLKDGEKVRVRFYGIDAPEKKQEYGIKSLDVLKKMIDGKIVEIDVKDKDQYGSATRFVMKSYDMLKVA